MRWLIASSLRLGRLVMAAGIGLAVVAVTQLRSAPVDVYPEFAPPSVEIQTEALGLSATEVEQLVTVPLEQDLLNGVPWLDHMHSVSMPGLSAIDLTFQRGTSLYAARQMVEERMTQAHALPNVGSPPIMIQPLASVGRVAMIRLSSRALSLIDMSVLARWKIRPRLMGVPGVANVAIYGMRDRQLQVQVDPGRLGAEGVSLTQVIETAGNALWVSPLTFVEASTPGTGGFVESPNQRLSIQHISPISRPAQLAAVPVQGTGRAGRLRLGDVAKVIVDHQPLIGDAVSGGTASLYLVIEKSPGANTLQVTRGVEDALAQMAPGLAGITVDSRVYRPATYLQTALRNVGIAGLAGLVLLLAVLAGVLGSWRAALLAGCVTAVSLTCAAYVLYLRGATFTTMSLLGLAAAVGACVDDVITDMHAARRQAGRPGAAGPGAPVTLAEALAAGRGPLLFAALVIAVTTVPVIAAGPLVSAFTRPFALTYLLAVLASMLLACTLTPVLAAVLLRGKAVRDGRFAVMAARAAGRLLAGPAGRPARAWAAAAVLAVIGAAAAFGVALPQARGHSVLPVLQDRNLLLRLETVPGTSLREMDRLTRAVVRDLGSMPAVSDVGAHVGRAVGSDQLVEVNSAEVWLTLRPDAAYGPAVAAVRALMHDFSGVRTTLATYPADRLAQAASASADDLIVRVYGADLGTLQRKAAQVRAMLAGMPGVAAAAVRPIPLQPTIDIEVRLAAAQKYGLRPGDVRRDATTLTSGLIVGSIYEQSRIYDVVVWGTPGTRGDLTELRNLLIDTPSGRQVALKDLAAVAIRPEPVAVTHDDVQRAVDVTARITGDPGAVTAAVRGRVAHLPMPYEYHAEVIGNAAASRSGLIRVLVLAGIALAIMLLLFQAAAGGWRLAGLLLLALPLSLAGGVLAAVLAGGIWAAGALAGLFAVLGLAARACVLLARAMLAAQRDRGDTAGARALTEAAIERSVPLAQSVLAIAAIMVPAAILGTPAGLEMLHPLAVTVLGGLASTIAVHVLVLPPLIAAIVSGGRDGTREPARQAAGQAASVRETATTSQRGDATMFARIAASAAAIAAAALLTACAHHAAELRPPATLTKVPGSSVQQVRLTAQAARRLGITTTAVRDARVAVDGTSGQHPVIPYSAVVYDTNGSTWTYVSMAPRTYLRQPITILAIRGDTAILDRGPAAGAEVVTVGAPELLGTEYNISGEQ